MRARVAPRQRFLKLAGQAAVDYSGAIVVACVIIGAVLALSPFSLNVFFDTLLTTVTTAISGRADGITF